MRRGVLARAAGKDSEERVAQGEGSWGGQPGRAAECEKGGCLSFDGRPP